MTGERRFGPFSGFAPLLGSELRPWIRTRLGWVQATIWTAILVGGMAIPLVALRDLSAAEAGGAALSASELHFALGALVPAIGAVILAHGAILGERQAGTAAWILSKPVSRASFLLAKWAAFAIGLLVTAHLIPNAIGWIVLSTVADEPLALGRFAAAAGMAATTTLWALGLTLLVGTLLPSRGAVLAIGLAVLVGGDVAMTVVPALAEAGPWLLGRMAVVVAQGGPLVSPWPIVSTLAGAVLFPLAAVAAFRRQEI